MPIQPSPIAETNGPLFPSLRCFITPPWHDVARPLPFQAPYPLLLPTLISATTGTAAFGRFQIGRNGESVPHRRIDKIDFDRLYPLKQFLADDVSNPFLIKHLIIFAWFIQNQAQGGP
jgi:hypothetical protein